MLVFRVLFSFHTMNFNTKLLRSNIAQQSWLFDWFFMRRGHLWIPSHEFFLIFQSQRTCLRLSHLRYISSWHDVINIQIWHSEVDKEKSKTIYLFIILLIWPWNVILQKKNNEKNKRDNMCYSVSSQIKKCNVFWWLISID